MQELLLQGNIIWIIAGAMALLVGIVMAYGWFTWNREEEVQTLDEQLAELLRDEYKVPKKKKPTGWHKWNNYWNRTFKGLGIAQYGEGRHASGGRDIIIIALILGILAGVFLGHFIWGVLIPGAAIFLINLFARKRAADQERKLNSQLPGFIFSIRANIQANETPEKAIVKVCDSMPNPLFDDVSVIRDNILAQASFKDALIACQKKTSSRDLQFLCACLIQAAGSGGSLESQLAKIQEVLEARQEVTDELDKAVKATMPAMVISSVTIPIIFIATILMDPTTADFWFQTPISWVAFAGVLACYSMGMWLANRMVKKVKNL